MNFPKFLSRDQAADYIRMRHGQRCSRSTLAHAAVSGNGPLFRLAGRYPVYLEEDLDDWARGRISAPRRSTSDHDGSPVLARAVA